nr:hypothetical protein [Nocardia cyriacigeorgica]
MATAGGITVQNVDAPLIIQPKRFERRALRGVGPERVLARGTHTVLGSHAGFAGICDRADPVSGGQEPRCGEEVPDVDPRRPVGQFGWEHELAGIRSGIHPDRQCLGTVDDFVFGVDQRVARGGGGAHLRDDGVEFGVLLGRQVPAEHGIPHDGGAAGSVLGESAGQPGERAFLVDRHIAGALRVDERGLDSSHGVIVCADETCGEASLVLDVVGLQWIEVGPGDFYHLRPHTEQVANLVYLTRSGRPTIVDDGRGVRITVFRTRETVSIQVRPRIQHSARADRQNPQRQPRGAGRENLHRQQQPCSRRIVDLCATEQERRQFRSIIANYLENVLRHRSQIGVGVRRLTTHDGVPTRQVGFQTGQCAVMHGLDKSKDRV